MVEPGNLLSGIILPRPFERVHVLEVETNSSNLASVLVLVDMVRDDDVCCVPVIDTRKV